MSDFIDALVDMMPEHSALKKENNQLRKVLEKTVGAWFDEHEVLDFYEQLFLTSATGKYLDLHGKDYGVYRKTDESDEDFRNRIVQEKLEHLTPEYLQSIFGLILYVFVENFDLSNNDLTSDNIYINHYGYMAEASEDLQRIIMRKFVLKQGDITWF